VQRGEEALDIVQEVLMLKELEDAMVLVGQQDEKFQRKVLAKVMKVLDEEEDWVSHGSPDKKAWMLIKYARDPKNTGDPMQRIVKKLLREMEE
jgi:hypothetical protein